MNKILSRDEAVSILNRWSVAAVRIRGTITSGGGAVTVGFIGRISEVLEVAFKISLEYSSGSDPAGEILVGLNTVEEYTETTREIVLEPRSTVTLLEIHLAGFIHVALFEYVLDEKSMPTYRM